MAGYVVRIALPDRPGALGLVASRIGAVGGDIVAINILERDEGHAVDEFARDIEVAQVAGVLLEQMKEDPPERGRLVGRPEAAPEACSVAQSGP